jgi:ABC-2 type transport system permease protein
MNKIWIIIQREYLTRVRNKTFLLSTFLTPLLIVGLIAVVTVITVKSKNKQSVAVADSKGVLKDALKSDESITYTFLPNADTSLLSKGYDAVLIAPGDGINATKQYQIYSGKNLSITTESTIERAINDAVETQLITSVGNISRSTLDSLRENAREVSLEPLVLSDDEQMKKGSSGVAYGVGYGAAFLIYITLFLYGAMVMRGVMEEKTNRIAEVVISSVKPYQLMMGKIIGIGAVGVTQFLLWILLIAGFSTLLGAIVPARQMLKCRVQLHNLRLR